MQHAHQLITLEKKKVVTLAVALAAVASFGLPMGVHALSVVNSPSLGNDRTGSALRVASADQLRNLGIGTSTSNTHGQSSRTSGLLLQSSDYGRGLSGAGAAATSSDQSGLSSVAGSLSATDYAQDLQGGAGLVNQTDAGTTSASAAGQSTDYGDTSGETIRFGFEN